MRLMTRVALFLVACGTLVPMECSAQERKGFWFGFSLGPGSAGVQCTDCIFNDRRGSGATIIKGGWTLNPQMLVGAEADIWTQGTPSLPDSSTFALTLANVSATFTYFPSASSGFFVKGGAGVSMADFDGRIAENAVTINLGKGPGFIGGAGYDFAVWRRVSLSVGVDYWYGRIGNASFLGNALARDWNQNIVAATFGITVP